MPKQGDIDYPNLIGPEGIAHAVSKPFSDADCARYLCDLGAIFHLLPPPPARILDLGIGTGWTSAFYARRGFEVVGQDISPDMISLAETNRSRYQAESLHLLASDYEELEFQDEFDAAVFYDSLHHSEDEEKALQAVYRALRPGAVCITLEPGEGHADAPHSREAREKYGVTERDMPPSRIMEVGRKIGFREFRIYQRPSPPKEILSPYSGGTLAATLRTFVKEFLLLRGLIRPFLTYRRALARDHIVVMRK